MRIEQHPAFVLHARPYRETSLLLECLTREHGRLGVVARGVRGELATLTAVETVGTPSRLSGDRGLAGLYLNELVVRLTGRQDPSPGLFDAYTQTLTRLGSAESLAWSLRRFERDLLRSIG